MQKAVVVLAREVRFTIAYHMHDTSRATKLNGPDSCAIPLHLSYSRFSDRYGKSWAS